MPSAPATTSQKRRTIPFAMIEDARRHIYEAAVRTPLVRLNWERGPAEIYLKLENLQPIGSFKIRRPKSRGALERAGDGHRAHHQARCYPPPAGPDRQSIIRRVLGSSRSAA